MIQKLKLETLYDSHDITQSWNDGQSLKLIEHPERGAISPNAYRSAYNGKRCPYCSQKMAHSKEFHSTTCKKEAIERGYEYIDSQGRKTINRAGNTYFHPNYVTLDHKINKARCPEKMFEYSNLQVMCWRCNQEKGDDNAFEIKHNREYLKSLAAAAKERYQPI